MEAKDPSKLFIDTGAFIALIIEEDNLHEIAKTYYQSLRKSILLYTSILVVSETYTWLRYHYGFQPASQFLDIIKNGIKTGNLIVLYPDPVICEKAHAILIKYKDQELSYADALSFAILEAEEIKDVFGFDNHFYIANCSLWPVAKGNHLNLKT